MANLNINNHRKGTRIERFVKAIERGGNKLPHPLTLFTILAILLLIVSYFMARAGISVTYIAAGRAGEAAKETTVTAVNLLSKSHLQSIAIDFVKTYITFFPIGLIVVMMMGISVAEKAGLISALMKKLVLGAPDYLVTFIVSLVGVCANLASDAGIVFAPAIGGAVFFGLGRHPIAGLLAGYAAAYGGFSANALIAGTDVLLAGITQSVTTSFGIDFPVHPLINWYAMIPATFLLAIVVTIITEKLICPILGEFDPEDPALKVTPATEYRLEDSEKKGLKAAGIASLIFITIMLFLTVPHNAFFRNEAGELLPKSPLTDSFIFILFIYFVFVGICFGRAAGTIKSGKDVAKYMESGLVGVAGFLIVCLPASMFIAWFGKSNIATIIAIKGAQFFQSIALPGIPLLMLFAIFSALVNIIITSGTTKWMLLAPVFVPMFYLLGFSPAAAQMAYRIGDSTTGLISPLSAYLPVMLGMMERYKSKGQTMGIGTVISLTLPYSVAMVICWTIFFGIWLLLGLPLGPGAPVYIN